MEPDGDLIAAETLNGIVHILVGQGIQPAVSVDQGLGRRDHELTVFAEGDRAACLNLFGGQSRCFGEAFGSFVAQVAEVSLRRDGQPKVHRVVCAIDCGEVVNPDTVEAQMEGGIAFGLSAALHGALHFQDGRVLPGNFDTYPLLRMREMPRVETHIIARGDPMGGVGESGTPPIAPAVCNALLALTGKPVRELPIARLS